MSWSGPAEVLSMTELRAPRLAFRISALLVAALVWGRAAPLSADETAAAKAPAPKVSYFKQIRPILQERCQGCHQPAKRQGGFVMTSLAEMQKGGDSEEPAFTAGKPEESFLISQVSSEGGKPPAMPKGADPLKPDQVELLKRWVAEGAVDDTPDMDEPAVDMEHPPVYALSPVISSLKFSPDGSLLAISGFHEVVLHKVDDHGADAGAAARLVGLSERIESAVFSPDGKFLAVTGGSPGRFGEVQIWDVAAKTLTLSVPVTYDTVYGVSWASDGSKVAFGCADNTVRAIDAKTGKQVLYQGAHSDWVLDTTFSTDNSHVISVGRDGSMKLTEVATQRFVDNITSITPGALKGGLMTVDRHPTKDELLIGGADGVVKIYQTYRTQARVIGDDFNRITRFNAEPVAGRIFTAQYSPDATRVVIGSSSDGRGEVRVLQEANGKLVSKFADQHGAIYAVAYRPDGKVVAVGGFDGLVRLFEPEKGTLLREFVPVPLTPQVAGK
ncbi:MAG TPA: c-type cytochrome domain-containing protein [Pirellulales bacterium]|nr:c-type cytochrome domain-containing protein [Pirellulales bacterium]